MRYVKCGPCVCSELETRWVSNIAGWQSSDRHWSGACNEAAADREPFMQWVGTVMMHRRHTRMETAMDQKIFSKFTWKDPCNGQTFDTYIEPLASSLRSPFFQCFNQPKDCYAEPGGCQKYGLSATSFLLMTSGQEVERIAPGNKRFFFDLGSTSFDRGVTGEADSFKDRKSVV